MLANTEPGYSVASAMNEGNRQRCRPPHAVIGFHLTHCPVPVPIRNGLPLHSPPERHRRTWVYSAPGSEYGSQCRAILTCCVWPLPSTFSGLPRKAPGSGRHRSTLRNSTFLVNQASVPGCANQAGQISVVLMALAQGIPWASALPDQHPEVMPLTLSIPPSSSKSLSRPPMPGEHAATKGPKLPAHWQAPVSAIRVDHFALCRRSSMPSKMPAPLRPES
jgi:hypothetical protein